MTAAEEESVDLTPGVVWTDAQLAVVRDLTARAYRAEAALGQAAADAEQRVAERMEALAEEWNTAGFGATDQSVRELLWAHADSLRAALAEVTTTPQEGQR